MRRRRVSTAAVVACCVGLLAGCGPRQPWRSELVTVNAAGTDAGDGVSNGGFELSPTGDLIAFTSGAGDLGPTDTNGQRDVFLRDLATGAVTLVSTNEAGTDSAAGTAELPRFSPDGTQLAYYSDAPDVVAGGTAAGVRQIYVYDLAGGTNTLVSADADGTGGGDWEASDHRFSPDGGRIVFSSRSTNLALGDDNGVATDVFVRDLAAGTTEIVSRDLAGTGTGDGLSFDASFALGGSAVVFRSEADDLVAGDDDNETSDVFLRDLATGTTTLLSARADGTGSADGQSMGPVVGPDGDTVAFSSIATDLLPTVTDASGIYLRDLVTGTITLVSAPPDGASIGLVTEPVFSPDGTRLAWGVEGSGILVRELPAGPVEWVSADVDGGGGNVNSTRPVFSPDGTRIAFDSGASNLGPTDTNRDNDVYVRDLTSGTTTLVSANADGDDSANGFSSLPAFAPDGRRIAFRSDADDLGPTDTNGTLDVYLATLTGADLAVALTATPEPVAAGGTVTYQVDVTNAGPDTGEDVTVALLLPPGVTLDGAAPSVGTCEPPPPAEPRLVVCDLGDLANGAEESVVATADVPASTAPGTALTARAAVSSPTVDPVGRNGAVAESTVAAG